MKTRRNRSAPPPPTGWSSLPDEVACAVLALSSADGFGNAGSVCKRFGRLVSTGAVTVARSRSQTRHTWLVCVGGCGRDDAQPIMTGDTVAAGWYENARDRVYGRAGCATEVGKDCLEIEAGLGLTEGDWRVLPRLRTGRAYAGIACVGGAHFVAVGGEGRTGLLRSAELLREGRAAPKALPSLRDGRRDPIVAVLTRRDGSRVVVAVGGYSQNGELQSPRHKSMETLAVADLGRGGYLGRRRAAWTHADDALTRGRDHETAAHGVIDDRYLIIAGGINMRDPGAPTAPATATATAELYDAWTDTWRACADMPERRAIVKGVVVQGTFYVYPEKRGGGEFGKLYLTYDVKTDTWGTAEGLPARGEIEFHAQDESGKDAVVANVAEFLQAHEDDDAGSSNEDREVYISRTVELLSV
jgi:hypothetical protein